VSPQLRGLLFWHRRTVCDEVCCVALNILRLPPSNFSRLLGFRPAKVNVTRRLRISEQDAMAKV
ncbi:MAG TPA: hypothetical protein VM715_01000, partial [Candidatus Acidoferrum sp.]|nr:hypothetical protein [Candidatus Acidoferrum sp.]